MSTHQPDTSDTAPPNRIRVETALSRYPIHRLAKKGTVTIDLDGDNDVKWEVSYNDKHGQPGPLAYKLDTLIVNQRIDVMGRPLPELIKIGSLSEICRALGSDVRTIASSSAAPDNLQLGDPAWSSDNWIVFVVAQNNDGGTCFKTRLDKIRPDGSDRTKVTDGGPNCTPNGKEQNGDADPGFSADGKTIYTSRGFPNAPAGGPANATERKLYAVSSDAWYPGKPETDLSLRSQPSCIEGVPKGSPDGKLVLLFRACFGAAPVNGIFITDTAGSYRTKIADGFGPDWNPAASEFGTKGDR